MATTIDDLKRQIAEVKSKGWGEIKTIITDSGNIYDVRPLSPWMSLSAATKFMAANIKTEDTQENFVLDDKVRDDYILKVLFAGMIDPKFETEIEVREFMDTMPNDAVMLFQAISQQEGGAINLAEFPEEQGCD